MWWSLALGWIRSLQCAFEALRLLAARLSAGSSSPAFCLFTLLAPSSLTLLLARKSFIA
jgi:hypothetical protein